MIGEKSEVSSILKESPKLTLVLNKYKQENFISMNRDPVVDRMGDINVEIYI